MISNNRADYGSADEWLSALKQDELWLSQLQQLQNSKPSDASKLRDIAYEKMGKGETYGFWDSYNHQVEPVVREVWDIAELSLPKLKIQTIGMLSMEWMEQQVKNGKQAFEKPETKKKPKKKPSDKPLTLKYFVHGNNGKLMEQRRRVDIVFKKFSAWKWIDEETSPDDFDSFFEGNPRHCNITWTGSTTILTILLQELLQQPYIEPQTGCSAKSLVSNQFGKTANSDRSRLDDAAEKRIKLTLLILDTNNPLPERRRRGYDDEYNIEDAALQEIFAGQLRSTKGI